MQIAADELTGAHIGSHVEFTTTTAHHGGTREWTWTGRLHTIEHHAEPDQHRSGGAITLMLGDPSSNVRVNVHGDRPITVHPHHGDSPASPARSV